VCRIELVTNPHHDAVDRQIGLIVQQGKCVAPGTAEPQDQDACHRGQHQRAETRHQNGGDRQTQATTFAGGVSSGNLGMRRGDRGERYVGGHFGHGWELTRTELEGQSRSYELDRWFYA
jgi:hypothetical protein